MPTKLINDPQQAVAQFHKLERLARETRLAGNHAHYTQLILEMRALVRTDRYREGLALTAH